MNISYKWNFEFDRTNKADSLKIFQVKDFYGDTCKAMASRIRGAASGNSFQVFREKSSEIIDSIIFKKDSNGKRIPFKFENNNLVITDVAIENLDPVDHQIEQSLNKSLNLTFEIENKARAAQANHTAAKLEQESRGQLERQKIKDEIQKGFANKNLLESQAETAAVKTTGLATSEAEAKAEKAQIEGKAAVKNAQLMVQSNKIKRSAELEILKKRITAEIDHKKALDELEINTKRKLADIEANKFKQIVDTIGKETIVAMARVR